MNITAIHEAFELARKLTLEEQLHLNTMLVANIKHVRTIEGTKKAAQFNIGEHALFDAGRKGLIKIVITGFSRDGAKLKGTQIGGLRPGCQWTVTSTVCKLV